MRFGDIASANIVPCSCRSNLLSFNIVFILYMQSVLVFRFNPKDMSKQEYDELCTTLLDFGWNIDMNEGQMVQSQDDETWPDDAEVRRIAFLRRRFCEHRSLLRIMCSVSTVHLRSLNCVSWCLARSCLSLPEDKIRLAANACAKMRDQLVTLKFTLAAIVERPCIWLHPCCFADIVCPYLCIAVHVWSQAKKHECKETAKQLQLMFADIQSMRLFSKKTNVPTSV